MTTDNPKRELCGGSPQAHQAAFVRRGGKVGEGRLEERCNSGG